MALGILSPSRAGGLMDIGFGADPFRLFQREMNRLFNDVFHPEQGTAGREGESGFLTPRMEARETDNEIRVTAELPGVSEKDIDVSLDDDLLTIRAEKRMERREEGENTHFTERAFGTFQRSLRLPFRTEPEQVRANFESGVLTVTIPKTKAAETARKIRVQGQQTGQSGQTGNSQGTGGGQPTSQQNAA